MFNRKSVAVVAMGLAVGSFATGCGKSLNDSQTADVGNVIGGMNSNAPGKSSASLQGEFAPEATAPATLVERVNGVLNGAIWLEAFKVQTGDTSSLQVDDQVALAPFTGSGCPASSTYVGMSCTATCSTDGTTATDTCKLTGTSQKETCGDTVYTATNETVGFSVNLGGITSSGGNISGSLSLSVNFSANITGGSLTGDLLACNIAISLDLGALAAGTVTAPTISCGSNFSCTYGGVNADCTKLQSKLSISSTCTAST